MSGEAARRMERRTLTYRLHENYGFLNSPHISAREKRIGREKYMRQSNVKFPSYISQGTLCFAYDKLFVKIIAASIEDSTVTTLYHLNVDREKEEFIHKKEQKTAGKERFVVERTVRNNHSELRSIL